MFTQAELTKTPHERLIKIIQTIKARNIEKAESLIAQMNQSELSKIDSTGETALTWAAEKGLDKVCEILIPKMTVQAINQIANNGETALTYAAYKGLEKVCELLISKMSDQAVNTVNHQGYTALSLATQNGFKNICALLNSKTNEQNNQINKTNNVKIAYEINVKIANNATINTKDKSIMEDTIKDISQKTKLLISKADKDQIINSMQKLIADKPTKLQLATIEDRIDKLIEQQNINHNKLTEKINIFQELVNKVNTNIANNVTINAKDKSIMEDTIKDIISKAQLLNNTTAIEKITTNMQKLIVDKPTKLQLVTIENQIDKLLEQQNKTNNDTIVNIVNEIIYDNPLLNHPELLQPAMEKFSLKEIGELSTRLSPDLITQAISSGYSEGSELILGGLMSLEYNEAPTG